MTFAKSSVDGSGKGHLASARKRLRQAGVLFEIDMTERGMLDSAEGLGAGYYRDDVFPVRRHDTKETVLATVYLAEKPDLTLVPYDWYLALIVAGAREHRFDRRRMRSLLASQRKPHTKKPWGGRNEALGLLQAAGVGDNLAGYFEAQTDLAMPRRVRPR